MKALGRVTWDMTWARANQQKKIDRLLVSGWEPFAVTPADPEHQLDIVYFRRMTVEDDR